MAFSNAVLIGDLNDFIAPSQACVVSLQGNKVSLSTEDVQADGQVRLHNKRAADGQAARSSTPSGGGGGFKQTYTEEEGGPVKVSLHDCLACSGCVTSAETVLLQHQSGRELRAKLWDPDAVVVVSISPQTRASLAALHGVPADTVQGRLAAFLTSMSVAAVLDVAEARELALAEAAAEFVERYQRSRECSTSAGAAGPGATPAAAPLPMLASACPGWVCYAEKTQADLVLPYISTTKSPQAVMGTFVKRRLAAAKGWDPARVYHCSVMPCYDKKLEASREDFNLPGTKVAEVDSCLTTGELQELLDAAGVKLGDMHSASYLHLADVLGRPSAATAGAAGNGTAAATAPLPVSGGGSGGYLEHVFRAAAAQLHGRTLPPGPLPLRVVRNADLKELELLDEATGKPLLRFAAAYGFRNIQTLMRKLKGARCGYDYVEVMACPGGCLNGGGQLKPAPGHSAGQLLDLVEAAYHAPWAAPEVQAQLEEKQVAQVGQGGGGSCDCGSGGGCAQPDSAPAGSDCSGAASGLASLLYAGWVGGGPGSAAAKQLLHTQYHKRERTVTAAISDW